MTARPKRSFYDWFRRFCARFGETDVGFGYSVAALLCFVMIRNYLELALMKLPLELMQLAHYTLFYYGLALSLALLLHALTGKPVLYTARLVFPGMIITLLPPTLDGTLFASWEPLYDYLPAGSANDLVHAYLNWFGPFVRKGVTPGMRIEIALATIGMFVFVHAHTGSRRRALLGAWLGYTAMFSWVALPVFIELPAQWLGGHWERDAAAGTRLIVILCAALTIAGYSRHRPALVRAVLRDARYLRLLHYELMFALGLCIAGGPSEPSTPIDYGFRVALGMLAVALAWIFAVINNNVFDLPMDRINAPERPLVTGAVELTSYVQLGWAALILALLLSVALNAAALVVMVVFCLAYFVYSSPPLRLKENCAVSKVVIGLNSVCCLVLGVGMVSSQLDAPAAMAWGVFVWFTLGAHLIDLKDVEGDRAAGIRNLSTILGLTRAQRVIGISAVLAHLIAAYVLRESWVAPLVGAAGLAQLWFVTRRPFREPPVMLLQNLTTLAVIASVVT